MTVVILALTALALTWLLLWSLYEAGVFRMTKSKRLALIICLIVLGLVVFYFLMKWTTPKDCMVPINRMSQGCKDFIYPE